MDRASIVIAALDIHRRMPVKILKFAWFFARESDKRGSC
jgi:hypothetical protein